MRNRVESTATRNELGFLGSSRPGENLAERIHRGPLGLRDTAAVARGVGAALAEAHERGVIHRDLKPSNLFLPGRDPARIVVLDFGIARRMLHMGTVTRTGVVIGTPQYMSPEQVRAEREIGPPTDIFSLGCVLYECLAGTPAFFGEHAPAILIKVLLDDPRSIRTWRADVPEGFANLIDRMLRKEPRARFPNGLALCEALRHLELPAEDSAPLMTPTMRMRPLLTPPRSDEHERTIALVGDSGTPPTLPPSLEHELLQLGAIVEVLADGTVMVTMPPSASASDQAFLAVRCGLILAEHLPDVEVAVATGRGRLQGQQPIGEAIDRAFELLKDSPAHGSPRRRATCGSTPSPRTCSPAASRSSTRTVGRAPCAHKIPRWTKTCVACSASPRRASVESRSWRRWSRPSRPASPTRWRARR
ncbi:MAG TPA: serine/threonine-protein kinase, partial [Kofleriaceae bacterium]|nr:serine/threonine-protein kinase [Kofleriaceae bacterium]